METPTTAIVPPDQHGADLIRDIRETALRQSTDLKPIVLIGLPRWAALRLGRARAKELGKTLNQAHAESLRDDPRKQAPHAILWLPCDGHPNGGLFLFCHRGYEAGLLMGWRNYRPIGFPRAFSEFPDPLCPWRSDQERWIKNDTVARKEYNALLREVSKLTRTTPAFVQPCDPLLAIIQHSTQEAVADVTSAIAEDAPKTFEIVTERGGKAVEHSVAVGDKIQFAPNDEPVDSPFNPHPNNLL